MLINTLRLISGVNGTTVTWNVVMGFPRYFTNMLMQTWNYTSNRSIYTLYYVKYYYHSTVLWHQRPGLHVILFPKYVFFISHIHIHVCSVMNSCSIDGLKITRRYRSEQIINKWHGTKQNWFRVQMQKVPGYNLRVK